MHQDFDLGSGVVLDFLRLDFTLFDGFQNRLDERTRRFRIGNFADDKRFLVAFLDFRTNFQRTTALTVVVARNIDTSARREVGEKLEILTAQVTHRRVAEFVEIVGQNLRGKSHGDALGTLRQQQRKLHGQRNRFFVATVVTELPLGGFRVEHHVEREFRQPRLDISASRRVVACEDVSPVSLRIDQQVFLPQLHERILDGSVAVGVELHRVPHDVRYFVISAIVHPLHRVHNAALHGFETVLNVGNGAVENRIRGIVEEPRLIHPRQVVHHRGVEAVHRFIVGMARRFAVGVFQLVCHVCFWQFLFVFVHIFQFNSAKLQKN